MVYPKKYLGQHFLKDRGILKKIIAAAELSPDDVVLEIGAGKGVLTAALAQRSKKVLAIEKDPALCKILPKKFYVRENIQIICADVLKINPYSLPLTPYSFKIVANIPYYITGRLLKKIFQEWPMPKLVVLMLQQEVAERICAGPPKMSLLSASVQFFADPKIMTAVPKTAFQPQPKVDSAIIRLTSKSSGQWVVDSEQFFEVVRAGFKQTRKLLASNLAKKYPRARVLEAFKKLKLQPNTRAAELTVEQWRALTQMLGQGAG